MAKITKENLKFIQLISNSTIDANSMTHDFNLQKIYEKLKKQNKFPDKKITKKFYENNQLNNRYTRL